MDKFEPKIHATIRNYSHSISRQISEMIECDTMNFFIDDFNYDEFQNFFTGKKSIIVEKISNKSSLLTPIALNIEKVIMSNKNSYMTIISKKDER